MQKSKRIVLPLSVGNAAITKPPQQSMSTVDLEIDLELQGKLLQSLFCQSSARISVKTSCEGHRVVVECNEGSRGGQVGQIIHLNEGSKDNSISHISAPPFRGAFRKANDQLELFLTKQLTTFHLFPVAKGRFVKNEVLSRVMAERNEEWGPLSMDKSQRIMLEPQGTTFPVIGLWIASEHADSGRNTILRLISHISASSARNCIFSSQGRSFIYLVHVGGGRSTPDLMLAEWKSQGYSQKSFHLSKQQAFTRAIVRLSSDESTALEFTLRSDEKVPEPLMNITCSPIKFPSSSPSPQTTRTSFPDSPRFKLDHSALLEQECSSLRRLTREQQIEIDDLRAEVLRLNGELRHYRRQRHHCDSEDLSLASSRAPSPLAARRLTRSDLNYDQPSIPNEEIHTEQKEERVLEAWEQFQIVEPTA